MRYTGVGAPEFERPVPRDSSGDKPAAGHITDGASGGENSTQFSSS